ncbi:hypothetical protein NFK08_05280 [Enterobacter roggenkampii]|uniref:hypothetical protein n=1 Tax=Enterobacter roggenkampii TaxID=1812935 RepID=UPI00242C6206|nr:hypothetical protein [Enterobacter roggenkampii]WFX59452.1 hypothetical protein NFK08_05280 [Enterobacter roggenkampii]
MRIKRFLTSDIYQITLTTQTGETVTANMSRHQPELVDSPVPLASETGEKRVQFTPLSLDLSAEV